MAPNEASKDSGTHLQSQDRRELLDIVDKLRSQGIGKYIDLPQIVVCGDQSSGKSSVLEAISGMSFPAKDNRCTCFATELILRRASTASMKITLQGGPNVDASERKRLESFERVIEDTNLQLGDVVNDAKDFMGLAQHEGSAVFSENVLRVEVSGPEQPHLTIVDLPGLFEAGSRDQSVEDSALVKSLVRSYMKKPRTIILAVVSAKNDFNLQSVTKYTRKLDPHGTRTLGLITKPDTLDKGSEMEASYLRLASNDDVKFHLGWHVVRNRDYATRNCTLSERDKQEKEFFSQGSWTSLGSERVGVDSLRIRLSNILHNHNLKQLPEVLQDVNLGLSQVQANLAQFGPQRAGSDDQKYYLLQARQTYSFLVGQAVSGAYNDAYFTGNAGSQDSKHLRAIVQNRLSAFSQKMHDDGQYWRIKPSLSSKEKRDERTISNDDYIERVKRIVLESRGQELPGTHNPLVVEKLFREQSKCWKDLIDTCVRGIVSAAYLIVASILNYSTDETTGHKLQKHLQCRMRILQNGLQAKVDEIYRTFADCHPITYNHYFTENIKKAQNEAEEKRFAHFLQSFAEKARPVHDAGSGGTIQYLKANTVVSAMKLQNLDADMDRFASEQAIIASQAYYKVARKQMVDDLAKIAIELQFMKKLDSLFDLDFIKGLTPQQLGDIAGETNATIAERKALLEKKSVLQEGQSQLQGLLDYQPPGVSRLDTIEIGANETQDALSGDSEIDVIQASISDIEHTDESVTSIKRYTPSPDPIIVPVTPERIVIVQKSDDTTSTPQSKLSGEISKVKKKKKS